MIERAEKLNEEKMIPGLTVKLASGYYQTFGALPEEKNGCFDPDGKKMTESEFNAAVNVVDGSDADGMIVVDD